MTLKDRLEIIRDRGYTYDSVTGLVTSPIGNIIKYKKHGYLSINTTLNKKSVFVRVHQFAWFIYHNEVPTLIDHKDRNKSNNKINNLRLSNKTKNMYNTDYAKGYDKNYKKYTSRIFVEGKRITLGHYYTEEEAHQAYLDAKKIYHIV